MILQNYSISGNFANFYRCFLNFYVKLNKLPKKLSNFIYFPLISLTFCQPLKQGSFRGQPFRPICIVECSGGVELSRSRICGVSLLRSSGSCAHPVARSSVGTHVRCVQIHHVDTQPNAVDTQNVCPYNAERRADNPTIHPPRAHSSYPAYLSLWDEGFRRIGKYQRRILTAFLPAVTT